ncbi:MAG: molybdopterin-dependent oxidoreductase, partial [Halobacteriaceae archaeon]
MVDALSAGQKPSLQELSRGFLSAIVGLIGSFAYAGPTFGFIVTPVTSILIDITPPAIIVIMIDILGRGSESLAFIVATIITVMILWTVAVIGARLGGISGDEFGPILGVYFAGWMATSIITRSPVTALFTAIPMAVTLGVMRRQSAGESSVRGERRRGMLKSAAGIIGLGILGYFLGTRRVDVASNPVTAISAINRSNIERQIQETRTASLQVQGLESPVSSIDDFYQVDIDPINPNVTITDWSVAVTGAVETEREFSYEDITQRVPVHRYETLRCVGDPLNGELMDTALWTGIPISRLLTEAVPRGSHVMLRAVDNYYEEFPIEALEQAILAYGMNGLSLPRKHGYPMRAL